MAFPLRRRADSSGSGRTPASAPRLPLAPEAKRAASAAAAPAAGANAPRAFLRGFFETEDTCRHVFKQLVAQDAAELCKPHELAVWVHALCAALGYRRREGRRAQVLACAEAAADLLWDRLWLGSPPHSLDELSGNVPQPVEETHLNKLLGMKIMLADGPYGQPRAGYDSQPYLRMQRALYDYGRMAPAGEAANGEACAAVALQMARHRTIVVSNDLVRICTHALPRIRYTRAFLRALVLRPDWGFLAYEHFPGWLRTDQDMMAEAAMAHPILLGVERVGLSNCAEFVLAVIDKFRYGTGAFVAFTCATNRLRRDASFVFEAVKRCPKIWASSYCRSDPHVALAYVLGGPQSSYNGKVRIEHTMCVAVTLDRSLLYAQTLLANSETIRVCPSAIYALFDESVQCNAEFALACFRALSDGLGLTGMLNHVHATLLADPAFRAELPAFDAEPKRWVDYDAAGKEHVLVTEADSWTMLKKRIADWEAYACSLNTTARKSLRPIEAKWLRGFVVKHDLAISNELRFDIKSAIDDAPAFTDQCPSVAQLGLQPVPQKLLGVDFSDCRYSRSSGPFQPEQVRNQVKIDLDRINGQPPDTSGAHASDDGGD